MPSRSSPALARSSLALLLALSSAPAIAPPAQSASLPGAGACCIDEIACEVLTAEACQLRGGDYQGDGTNCAPDPCVRVLTPVIGVAPTELDFGRVCLSACRTSAVFLFNEVSDPASQLVVTALAATPAPRFELVDPPALPLTIPGDGTRVPIGIRYCPSGSGPPPELGTITITAPNAVNSPREVPLIGVGDRAPICLAGGPYIGQAGGPVTFSGVASRDPDGVTLSYAWDFGDGGTGTGPTPTHTYAQPGTYLVTLTVADDCGPAPPCTTEAQIAPNLAPICDAGGPYAAPAGILIAFDGSGSSDPDGVIAAYAWSFGDGGTGAGARPTHVYAASGTYAVTLTVTDNSGASSSCQTSAEIGPGNQPPICNAGGPYSGAVGQPVAFDGRGSSDPDGTIIFYAWDFGDCGTGTGPTPAHAYTQPGTYPVRLCVTDDGGAHACCETSASIGRGRAPGSGAGSVKVLGANPNFALPLHAGPASGGCAIPVDCRTVRPTVNVLPSTDYTIYLMVANYLHVAGIQTAFDWDPGWVLNDVLFNCRANQLNAILPDPGRPGGPSTGTVSTAFDCVTGPALAVIGRLRFTAGPAGCITQVQSCYPFGVHAIDCANGIDLINANDPYQRLRLGKICVGQGGHDACDPIIATEPATWGRIKASYRPEKRREGEAP